MERLVERRVFDIDHAIGLLANPARHGIAVHRTPGERAQHEHVERALQKVERFIRHYGSPYLVWGSWFGDRRRSREGTGRTTSSRAPWRSRPRGSVDRGRCWPEP